MVDRSLGAAAFGADGAGVRIDPDAVHQGQVQHEAVVADPQARAVVAAAAHGQQQVVVAGEVDGGHHIGDIRAAGDQTRVLVDHAVVDPSGLLVRLHLPAR